MTKHILAIGHNDHVQVNPDYCPHKNTTNIMTGRRWAIAGDVTDDERIITQCLDCGYVKRQDGTWGAHLLDDDIRDKTKKIPY